MTEIIGGEARRPGRIEVVCGSMFSGKTEELIRRMRRAEFAKQKVEIFKPSIDTRYSDEDVVSHDQHAIPSTPIDSSASILLLTSDIDVVGIDEAQFFDMGIVDVCNELANRGVRVIVAGLDMDFRGVPFGPMPALTASRTKKNPGSLMPGVPASLISATVAPAFSLSTTEALVPCSLNLWCDNKWLCIS